MDAMGHLRIYSKQCCMYRITYILTSPKMPKLISIIRNKCPLLETVPNNRNKKMVIIGHFYGGLMLLILTIFV